MPPHPKSNTGWDLVRGVPDALAIRLSAYPLTRKPRALQLTAFFVTTVFVQLGFLDPMLIALNWPMVINKLQVR